MADRLGPASSPDSTAIREQELDAEIESALADTTGLHLEAGTRMDATNEIYYEDAFVDTTFLGRRLVATPETRYAGVLSGMMEGREPIARPCRRVRSEISLGDRLEREAADATWRSAGTDWTWTWSFDPGAEHRRDRTFGCDLSEWRAAMAAKARRSFPDEATTLDLGARTDLLRSSGTGSEFQPDRNGASVSAALDHLGLLGDEWRLGYRLAARSSPIPPNATTSSTCGRRRWKAVASGRWLALDGTATRRVTVHVVPTSRDNFWIGDAAAEGRTDLAGAWSLGARAEGEATHYDLQDSTLSFDYQVARGRLRLNWEPSLRLSFALGPQAELLRAPLSAGEEYRELGGLPRQLRFRAIASLRWEDHEDPTQDARSVYTSLELTRALR